MSTPTRSAAVYAARPPEAEPVRSNGGLTALAVVLLVVTLGVGGALVDSVVTSSLGWIFGGAFVGSCLVAALLVRRGDVAAALITPPLVYAVGCAVEAQLVSSPPSTKRLALEAGVQLATHAPTLYAGTLLGVLVVVVRVLRDRRG